MPTSCPHASSRGCYRVFALRGWTELICHHITLHDALQFHPHPGAGRDVFGALVRQIDRIDPAYRQWAMTRPATP